MAGVQTFSQEGAHQWEDAGAGSAKVVLVDRRLLQRVAFVSAARLQWPGHDVACSTADLGMQGVGCRLQADMYSVAFPATGSAVQVTLTLNGTLTVFPARVAWFRLEGTAPTLGLQFSKVQGAQEALLQSVVLTGTPV